MSEMDQLLKLTEGMRRQNEQLQRALNGEKQKTLEVQKKLDVMASAIMCIMVGDARHLGPGHIEIKRKHLKRAVERYFLEREVTERVMRVKVKRGAPAQSINDLPRSANEDAEHASQQPVVESPDAPEAQAAPDPEEA